MVLDTFKEQQHQYRALLDGSKVCHCHHVASPTALTEGLADLLISVWSKGVLDGAL